MTIFIKRILAGMLLVTGMVQAGTPVEKAYSAEKPNILLIISDDQGYGDFGFMGNTMLRTPELDKLAASAAIFENYSTGVACSPGRAMIFTGRNHLSTGVWGVGARFGLRRDETLMPMFFRKNGYSTFYLGKGDCVAPHRMSPHYAGWQESMFVGGYQHHNARLYHTPLAPLHSTKPVDVEGWTSEFMTQRGIEFMKEKKRSPWLLTMAYIIPHTPWKPVDERYAPYYRGKGCSENIAACFSHIEQMDTCVGQLLDTLKETGQDENTIVVFVSDNGQTGPSVNDPGAVEGWIDHPDWAIRNVAGLRGNKSTAWENGTRVPLLVSMLGTIPVGQRTQFATAEDLLPTLLDVAGIPQDSVAHKPISGISLRSALLDEKAKIEHPEVFRITSWGEHSLTGKVGYIPDPTAMKLEDYQAVLRGPKFKMMMYPGGRVELYDIVKDKAESKDISKKHPEVTARMLVECRRQFRALIDDGAFRHSTIYIGDPSSKNRGGRTYFDSARRIQSHTGNVRAIPTLNGFTKEGDSVTYAIDSAAAGMYAISLTGAFTDAAPLRVEVAGNVLLQQALNGNKLTFGTVNLPKGQFPLKLVAGKPKGEARAATVDDIFFEASRPAASKPLGLRPGPNDTPAPSTLLGLYVEDGALMRNGSEFRAMGINYSSAWYDVLKDPETLEVAEGFRILKQDYGIPFIRFSAGPFAHTGWKLYVEDPEEYLRRFDVLVKHAEAQGLGLIPSLFWFVSTMPDLQGEPLSALGDPDSKCRAFMRQYIRDLVGRYKDSPAIWGWEVGNEWNLFADLPKLAHLPPKKIGSKEARTAADKLLRPMIINAYNDFYKTVREIDPDRIIVTGDSIARPSAWHNRNQDAWRQDSKAQWAEVYRADTPDCYDVASFHLYAQAEKSYFEKKDLAIEDFVKEVVGISRSDNKVIWCGELGMPGTDEASSEMFSRMMHAVEENEIEISAIWNFKPKGKFQADWDISPINERAYMLDAVKELNDRFAIGLNEDAAK